MNLDYFLYMAEVEGHDELVNTRLAKLNAIGRELQKKPWIKEVDLLTLCNRHGVYDVTKDEIRYIKEEWL